MADAGPDTAGSQFFIMHSRAAHLEGRYTQLGHVVSGIEVLDRLIVGDRVLHASVARVAGSMMDVRRTEHPRVTHGPWGFRPA